MTKSAARRAIAGGCKARAFSQDAPTNLKSYKPRAGTKHGAGLFYRNIDAQRITDIQTDGFASRY